VRGAYAVLEMAEHTPSMRPSYSDLFDVASRLRETMRSEQT
jgi:hypothetical protein